MTAPLFSTRLTLMDDGSWLVAHTVHETELGNDAMRLLVEGGARAVAMADDLSATSETSPGSAPVHPPAEPGDPVVFPDAISPDGDQVPDGAA